MNKGILIDFTDVLKRVKKLQIRYHLDKKKRAINYQKLIDLSNQSGSNSIHNSYEIVIVISVDKNKKLNTILQFSYSMLLASLRGSRPRIRTQSNNFQVR
jgi:hypothetical protein